MPEQVVLNQAIRQGTYISASMLVPSSGYADVTILADISQADLQSTKQMHWQVQSSADNGASWVTRYGGTWTGPTDGQPAISVGLAPLAGLRVRVVVDIPVSMRIGASVIVA